ncbi:hypothetical protein ACDX78_03705 [Virgibacillus oceani]
MRFSAFISTLLGFTFTFLIVSAVRGAFDWVMWGSLLLGGVIAYIGVNMLKSKKK